MRRVSDQLGSRRVATIGVPAMFLHGTERLGLFIIYTCCNLECVDWSPDCYSILSGKKNNR